MDHHAADSHPGRLLPHHHRALQRRRGAVDADRFRPGSPSPQHGAGADQRRAASGRAGARLRADLVDRRQSPLHRCRSGRDRTDSQGLGEMGTRRSARRAGIALSIADGAAAGIHRAARASNGRTTTSRWCCRSSFPLDGGTISSTISGRCSSKARCCSSQTPSSPACLFIWRGKACMDIRTRASIVTIRLAALVVMIASVAALWNFMLWLPWQVDCLVAMAAAVRVRLQVRARGAAVMHYGVTQADRRRLAGLVFPGNAAGPRRAARTADSSGAVVEGDVPDGRRLLLDARIPARHRVSRGRRARAHRDVDSRHPDARGRAAGLQPGRRGQPERTGQHLDARGPSPALARQGIRPGAARIRRHRLHHHDYSLGRRRHRAHHPQPVRATRRSTTRLPSRSCC